MMSMNDDDNAEEIRRRMTVLRRELDGDVRQVSKSARAMADWTFYVRQFPWIAAGLAVGTGFLLVPRKKQTVTPDPAAMAAILKDKEVWKAASEKAQSRGLVKTIAVTIAAAAGRAALAYVPQRIQAAAAASAHKSEAAGVGAPSTLSDP